MSLNVRRTFLVDRRLQLAVALRGVIYWCFCVVSIACWILCWWMIARPDLMMGGGALELWRQFGPPLIASLFLLPVVVADAIRLSNRMAGPMYRLRKAMHQLAEGEQVSPLTVRKKDWWQDAVEDFNRIAERLHQTQQTSGVEPSTVAEPATQSKAGSDKCARRLELDHDIDIDSELQHALAE